VKAGAVLLLIGFVVTLGIGLIAYSLWLGSQGHPWLCTAGILCGLCVCSGVQVKS
jgi:hypothetical protein